MLDENRSLPDHTLYLFRARHLIGRSGLFCYDFGDGMIAGSTLPVPGLVPLPPAPDAESIFISPERFEPEQPRIRLQLARGETACVSGISLAAGEYTLSVRGMAPETLEVEIGELMFQLEPESRDVASGNFSLPEGNAATRIQFHAGSSTSSIYKIEIRPLS